MPSDAIVVGGGVGGLVVARRLALEGWSVTLLEQSDRLGGQVACQRIADVALDAAAESFATRGGAVATLLDELGLGGDIVTPRAGGAWLHRADGSAVPLPATGILGIPGDPLAPDVIRAIGPGAAQRAAQDAAMPADEGADAASLGELVRVRMGAGVVEGLLAPVVRGVHSADPDTLPVERAHPRLREELRKRGSLAAAVRALREASPAGTQVASIRGGMFRLVDALEADLRRLDVEIEFGADTVQESADSIQVHGRRREARIVRASPDAQSGPGRLVTLVTLVVDAPALDASPRGTGVLVAAGAPGVEARALTHLTAKWEWVREALPAAHALRLSYDGEPGNPIERATTDAAILLGAPIEAVIDAGFRVWNRSGGVADTDLAAVGETVAGTGLASVVAHAERTARDLSMSRQIRPAPQPQARMEQ
jgi:oxygen-dependent protoporphyrinogen oxidase